MEKLIKFVSEHVSDDISRLILNRSKWPDIDMDLAVSCIESRRKLKGKINEWYNNQDLIFPAKLSAEQCSSSDTGRYKAAFAERIASGEGKTKDWKIADLTGGLGVDTWFFSQKASEVLYNEMQKPLCEAAVHNFNHLGSGNIRISNCMVSKEGTSTPEHILSDFCPDIVYMDPARRGEGGKKVFLIEDCTPDVLLLKDDIFSLCRHILLKLSPMADISMVCSRLGKRCREVHIVASGGECKELLIWMDREWDDEYSIHSVELSGKEAGPSFSFRPSEERNSICTYGNTGQFLFEPGKALMKSGAFNLISERFGIEKLGISTHYYLTDDICKAGDLKMYGKVFRISDISPLDKRSIKDAGKRYPYAEVTARNIPMDTDTLRKKLGVSSGGNAHIFGLKSDSAGNLLIIAERI